MKKVIQALSIFACTSFFLSVSAESVRQITWDDLIPANLIAEDPIGHLTEDQQDMVYWVINMLESLPERSQETEAFYKEIDEAMPTLKKYDIDIAAVMNKRKEIRTAVVEKLNGKNVRIPGYLLPLEISQEKVTEFLLVPYVGACIHVPPPPPNQIVHVKTAAKKGYKMKQLYDPVWVTGAISAQSMVKDLYLVDGSAGIDIGYTMQANQIEPYE
ncbi:MAG: DUF3299 domain-containing protein [Desulfosarcina sp.]|jgi:hypothetical protein